MVIEWLAKLHGLSHVMMSNYPGGIESWRKDNPWSVTMFQDLPPIVTTIIEMMKEEQKEKFIRIAEILAEDSNGIDYIGRVKAFVDLTFGWMI